MPTEERESTIGALPDEETTVERPLIGQLGRLGWSHIWGDLDDPTVTYRERFREVLLKGRLKAAIRKLNRNDDGSELDELTVERAIRELEVVPGSGLLEKNEGLTRRLIYGVTVDSPDGAGRRGQLIRFIDFEDVGANDFLAINQFRVNIPGTTTHARPDIVLFVNGIPLVVIECKSPAIEDPINEAINQLLRYSNHRDWVKEDEGIPDLFLYNQVIVATDYYHAVAGPLGAGGEHYHEWKDTSPVPTGQVAHELGKPADQLKPQEILVAGMLRPAHLLDLVRNFTLFQTENGRLIKILARYPQYRAVHASVRRLLEGPTRAQTGDQDRRGGIIWHTQGSGKSLTMVFLVRKMRTIRSLRNFKVVVVTDRTDLENQLRGTMVLAGENLRPSDTDQALRARRPSASSGSSGRKPRTSSSQ